MKIGKILTKTVDGIFLLVLFLLTASLLTTKSTGTLVLTLKRAMRRAFSALTLDFGAAQNGRPAFDTVLSGFSSTLSLLILGVLVALVFGILKGILDSDKGKNRSSVFSIGTTILPVSLPEILVVVLLQRVAVLLSQWGIPISSGGSAGTVSAYLIPTIAISILPGCYISRILSGGLNGKFRADFIKTAYGKGLNSLEVLWRHAIPNAIPLLLESLPALSTIFIGNLMVIEYAFSWPGIARGMLYYFGKGDGNSVFAGIVLLAVLWLGLVLLFQGLAELYRRRR